VKGADDEAYGLGYRVCDNSLGRGLLSAGPFSVITFTANGVQKVAVTIGVIFLVGPVEVTTGKIAILGVEDASASQ